MATSDVNLWSERNIVRMEEAMERAFLRQRMLDVNIPPLIGFGLWVDTSESAANPERPPNPRLTTKAGNRIMVDDDDRGGDGVTPTVATGEAPDPIKSLRAWKPTTMHALGLSLPLSALSAPPKGVHHDLDAELRSLTDRHNLVVLANGTALQRDWSGTEPSGATHLETTEYSDGLRRAFGLPTPPPASSPAGGLVLLWILRINRHQSAIKREPRLKVPPLSLAEVLALMPATLPKPDPDPGDVVKAVQAASEGRTWDDVFGQVKGEAPDVGKWFDIGSFSRSRSQELSILRVTKRCRPRAAGLVSRAYEELLT